MNLQKFYSWMNGCFYAGTLLVVGISFLSCVNYTENKQEENVKYAQKKNAEATLLAYIQIEPQQSIAAESSSKNSHLHVQPGTAVKLNATVSNVGAFPNHAGEIYIKYAFTQPLDKEEKSQIFQTEKQTLPIIAPGQKQTIAFSTIHQTPSIMDFVKEDWALREYQVVAIIDQEEKIIGTLALTFSAYYYPGIHKEIPVSFSQK